MLRDECLSTVIVIWVVFGDFSVYGSQDEFCNVIPLAETTGGVPIEQPHELNGFIHDAA